MLYNYTMNKKLAIGFALIMVFSLVAYVPQAEAKFFSFRDLMEFLGFVRSNKATSTVPTKTPGTTPTNKPTVKPVTPVGSQNQNKITPEAIPVGKIGDAYNTKLIFHYQISDSSPSWEIIKGALPAGVVLKATNFNEGTIVGTPTKSGTYYFTVRAKAKNGTYADREYKLVVNEKEETLGKIQVLTPNGGESWQLAGTQINISWKNEWCKSTVCPDVEPTYDISLVSVSTGSKILLVEDDYGNSYSWLGNTVVPNQFITAGQYKIEVCGTPGGCDMSDKPFTLVP